MARPLFGNRLWRDLRSQLSWTVHRLLRVDGAAHIRPGQTLERKSGFWLGERHKSVLVGRVGCFFVGFELSIFELFLQVPLPQLDRAVGVPDNAAWAGATGRKDCRRVVY